MLAVVLTKSKKNCKSDNNVSILQVNENFKNSFLRRSHPELLLRKGVPCSKFTREQPCQSVKSHFGMSVFL